MCTRETIKLAMAKNLIIVESPTEAKTITKFVSSDYSVLATYGHFRKDSDKDLDINLTTFEPHLRNDPTKKDQIARIRKAIDEVKKKGGTVIIQTDQDREGEGIAWCVVEEFKLKKGEFQRMRANSIEKEEWLRALKNNLSPDIDRNMVASWKCRKVLDKSVGFLISPVLWYNSFNSYMGLSAGRVQSAVLKILVDRERLIGTHSKTKFYTIHAEYTNGLIGDFEDNGEKLSLAEAQEIYLAIKDEVQANVIEYKEQDRKKLPPEPFDTPEVQQAASGILRIPPKKLMQMLQSSFEEGNTTYMRTDEIAMPESTTLKVIEYITKKYGKEFVERRDYLEVGQGGHTAILPTIIENSSVGTDYDNVYQLVWKRSVASQMIPAIIRSQKLATNIGGYKFFSGAQKITQKGYIEVYDYEDIEQGDIPKFTVGEKIEIASIYPAEHETKPASRFSSATLVATMKKHGIGRPSTYANILAELEKKEYISTSGENQMITVTPKGMFVISQMEQLAPELIDLTFTAKMEKELDKIASGEQKRLETSQHFHEKILMPIIDKAGLDYDAGEVKKPKGYKPVFQFAEGAADATEATACPVCGSNAYKRCFAKSQYSPTMSCEPCGFALWRGNILMPTEGDNAKKCAKCGKPMVKAKSKDGSKQFYRCVGGSVKDEKYQCDGIEWIRENA